MCALQAISNFLNVTSSTASSLGLFSPDKSSDKPEWAVGRRDLEPPEYMKDFEKNTKDFIEQQAKSRSIERYHPQRPTKVKRKSSGSEIHNNIPRNKRKISRRQITNLQLKKRESSDCYLSDYLGTEVCINELDIQFNGTIYCKDGRSCQIGPIRESIGQQVREVWEGCKKHPPRDAQDIFDCSDSSMGNLYCNNYFRLSPSTVDGTNQCECVGYSLVDHTSCTSSSLSLSSPSTSLAPHTTVSTNTSVFHTTTIQESTSVPPSTMTPPKPMLTPTPSAITEEPELPNTTMAPTMFGSGFPEESELPTNTTTMDPNLELPIPTATFNQTESTLLTTAHPTCTQTVNDTTTITETATSTRIVPVTSTCVLKTIDPTETIMTSINSPVTPTPSTIPEETELPTENKEDDNKPFYYALGAGGLAFGWAILSTIGCAYQYITKRKAKSSNDQHETISLSSQIQTCDITLKECEVTSKPGKSGIYSFACKKIFFWKNNDTEVQCYSSQEVYFWIHRRLHVSFNLSI